MIDIWIMELIEEILEYGVYIIYTKYQPTMTTNHQMGQHGGPPFL